MKAILFVLFMAMGAPCFADDLGFKDAAKAYAPNMPLFAEVLEAISFVESQQNPDVMPAKNSRRGKNGQLHVSYDHTHMQINDHYWKRQLDKIDSNLWPKMLKDPKTATKIGAWILSQNIEHYGWNEHAIAAYNTGRAINLEDCLKGTASYKGDGPITPKDFLTAKARMERGRQYALKVYNYLVRKGHKPSSLFFAQGRGKGTASAPAARRVEALPMRNSINVAEHRQYGSWRRIK